MSAEPPRRTASSVGVSTLAQRILAQGGQAVVLAVFPSAAYLAGGQGNVVSLAAQSLGFGPLSVVVEGEPKLEAWLAPGAPVLLSPDSIRAQKVAISLSGAAVWDPRPDWTSFGAYLAPAHATLRSLLLRHAPAESLASLLQPEIAGTSRNSADGMVRTARAAAGALLQLLASPARDPQALAAVAGPLAGLGGGFTPAGDDFLMGAMYAVRVRFAGKEAARICRALALAASPRTTTVSAAYLRAAAEGAAGQAWHRLLAALATVDVPDLEGRVSDLCRIGHTSGADALAGFVLALESLPPGR